MLKYLEKFISKKEKFTDHLVIVFANHNYLPVLQNWLTAMDRLKIDNYLIIALDKDLHTYLKDKSIPTLLRPCELDLGKLWVHRVEILLELMKQGYDVIHSDADAIWLKDPLPYLNALPQDMIFSQGTIWPPDVQEKWGFVLCCGFFMLRSNKKTLHFMQDLLKRVKEDKDDQVSCNRLLLEMNTIWDEPIHSYTIDFRDKQFVCTPTVRNGACGKLTLGLLPHNKFQRIFEEADDVYVKHLISEKNSEDILDVLKNHGCWLTP